MRWTWAVVLGAVVACGGDDPAGPKGGGADGGPQDSGAADAPVADAALSDDAADASGTQDGAAPADAPSDAGPDATGDATPDSASADATADAGMDAGMDAGAPPPCGDPALPPWATATGATLTADCGALTLGVEALADGIVRLTYERGAPARPSWAVVAPPSPPPVAAGALDGGVRLCTASLVVNVAAETCRVRVEDGGGNTLLDEPAGGGSYAAGAKAGLRRLTPPGERFYGFGERTGALDKRGRVMTNWATDAYVDTIGGWAPGADPLYQAIPFFVALRDGRATGVLTDVTAKLRFDMAAAEPDVWEVEADAPTGAPMVQVVVAGPTFAEVLDRATALTGRPALPPRWALGYHQSRWGWSPDDRVREVAARFRSEQIPADALYLDIQHLDGFRSWTWDPATFPDPSALVADLEALGFRTVVIVDPAIKVDPSWDVYAQGIAGGHFIEGAGGAPYVGKVWPGDSVFPDFTAPATRTWWAGLAPRASQHGVRGLWIDMNEPSNFQPEHGGTLPGDLPVDGDGAPSTTAETHNVYALLEAKATYEGLAAARPDERPFLLSRAGYAGIQRYAAVWTGDAPSTWTALQETLPMLLGLGLSGVPFVGSDVGGYSGGPSPELFARWMALGSVSPFFRGHVTQGAPDQEPWEHGIEVRDIARALITDRYTLLPTWMSLAREAARTGAPPLRPLAWEFQEVAEVLSIGDQALVGPWIMVAPVLAEGATERTIVFPPGRWFEAASGAVVEGPTKRTVGVTLAALPTFIREGAIVARGPAVQWSDQAPVDPLLLDCYPAEAPSSFTLFEEAGAAPDFAAKGAEVTWTLQRTATGATLTAGPRFGAYVPPPRRVLARLRRVDAPPSGVTIDGAPVAQGPLDAVLADGAGWAWDPADLSLLVGLPADHDTSVVATYDPTLSEVAPQVAMPFTLTLPASTPPGSTIHIATDVSGWTHAPVGVGGPGDTLSFTVTVPRGVWFEYKLTRGGWDTVEKWPGCEEATNRYAFGAAHPVKADTVWAWADQCQ